MTTTPPKRICGQRSKATIDAVIAAIAAERDAIREAGQ